MLWLGSGKEVTVPVWRLSIQAPAHYDRFPRGDSLYLGNNNRLWSFAYTATVHGLNWAASLSKNTRSRLRATSSHVTFVVKRARSVAVGGLH